MLVTGYNFYNKYLIRQNIPRTAGPLFTKREDVLPPNLVKSQSHEILA